MVETVKENIMACVCTYNEENNIKDCIRTIRDNGIEDILVVDASIDNTKEIALAEGVKCITCEKGLAIQRQKAIELCEKEYLVFVDADDRLKEDCIDILMKEMQTTGYDAIQASVRVYEPKTYWQKAIDATWQYGIYKVGPSNMVGRPAIYRAVAIKDAGADIRFANIGNEDTAIAIRMEKKGYKQGIGSGISNRICHASYKDNKKEWVKYGKGDAMVIKQYPEKKKSIYWHLLYNYPVKRSMDLIKNGKGWYCLYPILIGWTRFRVMKKQLRGKII